MIVVVVIVMMMVGKKDICAVQLKGHTNKYTNTQIHKK